MVDFDLEPIGLSIRDVVRLVETDFTIDIDGATGGYVENRAAVAEQILQMEQEDVLLVLAHGRPHREVMATISEAQRLSIPIIALVGKEDSALAQHAEVAIVLPRAKKEKVAMHGASLVFVEALTLALAAKNRDRTLNTLDRLIEIRQQIRPN